jgi:calcium-dependent protein kinase
MGSMCSTGTVGDIYEDVTVKKGGENEYEQLRELGVGASCRVIAVRHLASNQKAAMKILLKSNTLNASLFKHEVFVLRLLNHSNILTYIDCFEEDSTYHILTSLCEGGELFDRVKEGNFSERSASLLAKQMIDALDHCHSKNVVHRDLKPENFVFVKPSSENGEQLDSTMKLIDFGCAVYSDENATVKDVAGSPYYVAPEVLSDSTPRTGKIWKCADMWSIGVIIFLLVCGFPPFNGSYQNKIFKKIKKAKFRFPTEEELGGVGLSGAVKDLISKLLVKNPLDRLSASEALQV